MNEEIKFNLEALLNESLKKLNSSSLQSIVDDFLLSTPYFINLNPESSQDKPTYNEIERVKRALKNPELINSFEVARKMEFNKDEIIKELKSDILNSIPEMKESITRSNIKYKKQILFLEYDHEPIACLCGFGKGSYPILKNPEYIDYNYREELYNGIGKVDYRKIWKNLIEFDQILDELNIFYQIIDTELYHNLSDSYRYKTYLFLYETFDELSIEIFEGIPIEKPLMIYGNEHDLEAINIYAFT
ncbi:MULTISPECIES: hypothetical protein [Flavobacteriaceae]|uniref:hypothetical protein n=1 Tax=Flavobacteriaceae TaxID=49546 RepID=UPI0010AEC571|nr:MULTISPECIES: hypothetical protein [Flavobacteriaceae]NJB36626.1 hypothetical protein [Croceivirga sp. JEA036]TKD67227.1 hypothetical protein FBT53_00010 [Flavobacterium sp. ASW18X]